MTVMRDQVLAAIEALGGSSHAIADSLLAKGITGMRVFSDRCPLANYLKGQFPDRDSRGLLCTDGETVYVEREHVPLPEAAARFVSDFDSGRYPELIQR